MHAVDAQAQTLLLLTYADVCGRMRTYADALRVNAQAQTLVLEAGMKHTLYDVFGVPNMHLSYGVIRQTVNGLADTRYTLQVPSVC